MGLAKIISGGQTGIDRGTLDMAIACGFPCGGWCPSGRLAEDGRIPERYPLIELKEGGYSQRTLRNVLESDGTVILYFSQIEGGTEETLLFCINERKPYKLRHTVERGFAWEDKYRKLVIRYERLEATFKGFRYLAAALVNYRTEFGKNPL
jgi:Circularly permutated YpsA SLOG family